MNVIQLRTYLKTQALAKSKVLLQCCEPDPQCYMYYTMLVYVFWVNISTFNSWRTEDYFLSNHNYIHSTFRWRLRLRRRRDYRYEANWIGYITNPLPTLFEDQSVGWRDLVITPSCINLQYRLLATKLGENRFEKVTSLRKNSPNVFGLIAPKQT